MLLIHRDTGIAEKLVQKSFHSFDDICTMWIQDNLKENDLDISDEAEDAKTRWKSQNGMDATSALKNMLSQIGLFYPTP